MIGNMRMVVSRTRLLPVYFIKISETNSKLKPNIKIIILYNE